MIDYSTRSETFAFSWDYPPLSDCMRIGLALPEEDQGQTWPFTMSEVTQTLTVHVSARFESVSTTFEQA